MGLIWPGEENLLDFLELRQVLSTYEGASGIRSGGLSKGQSPRELLGGLSGFLSRRCQGLRSCVEMGMWGNFLSCSKRVKYPLEVPEVRCD